MNKTNETHSQKNDSSVGTNNVGITPDVWKMRYDIAKDYCTKEDARDIKKDLHTRISDVWKVVIPLLVAILGLIGWIIYLILTHT